MSDLATIPYTPPVERLLTYGDARQVPIESDYLSLGLGPEHIPELIRLALDLRLHRADTESLDIWAPIHAWRALGQLRAESASVPLLSLFDELDADEWIIEEMPKVYGLIGSAAIPALTDYFAQAGHLLFSYVAAAACLREIGRQQPAVRAECVSLLAQHLKQFAANDPTLNGCLISDLIDLKAIEAAPLMARAFEACRVDLSVAGDCEDVQVELGLLAQRETPQRNDWLENVVDTARETAESVAAIERPDTTKSRSIHPPAAKKDKAKRKQAEKSRKKNRKRK